MVLKLEHIVAGVVGLVILCIIGCIIRCCIKKKKKNRESNLKSQMENTTNSTPDVLNVDLQARGSLPPQQTDSNHIQLEIVDENNTNNHNDIFLIASQTITPNGKENKKVNSLSLSQSLLYEDENNRPRAQTKGGPNENNILNVNTLKKKQGEKTHAKLLIAQDIELPDEGGENDQIDKILNEVIEEVQPIPRTSVLGEDSQNSQKSNKDIIEAYDGNVSVMHNTSDVIVNGDNIGNTIGEKDIDDNINDKTPGEEENIDTNIVKQWKEKNVIEFLETNLKLNKKYIKIFKNNQIDGESFLLLKRNDLKEMGIKTMGTIKKIENAINQLQIN